MSNYEIGQIFYGSYQPEVALWCNENNCYIKEIEPLVATIEFTFFKIPCKTEQLVHRYQIVEVETRNDEGVEQAEKCDE